MCAGVERSASQVKFSPDVKCCSYIPHLANFLAGRSLAGPGRSSVVRRIHRRAGVTPLGLGLSHADILRMVGAQSHFGQEPVVCCPHFVEQSQGCAIWQTRNAVCSTWFCKHERGAVGQRFWHAVRDLLIAAEERAAHHCLTDAGLPDEQVSAVLRHRAQIRETVRQANTGQTLSSSGDDESAQWYARMWGDWQGREEEWFLGCAQTLASSTAQDLSSWMEDARELVDDVGQRFTDLQDHALPERLRFAPGTGSQATADVLRLVGYSPYDPLELPAGLEPGLWLLDGRPLPDVIAQAQQTHDVLLDDALLSRLHDFAIALTPQP